MAEEQQIDNDIEEQYYQFLREQQLRDINLLTELPEDYQIKENTKLPAYMNSNLVKDQTCNHPSWDYRSVI